MTAAPRQLPLDSISLELFETEGQMGDLDLDQPLLVIEEEGRFLLGCRRNRWIRST